jgi:tetratricopeptide (TPR) repeat protein
MVSAMAHHQLGNHDQAGMVFRQGLAHATSTLPPEARLFDYVGWNDWIIARALIDEASELTGNHLPTVDSDRAKTLRSEALRLRAQDKFAEAEPLFREAYEIHRQLVPADHYEIAVSATLLGDVLISLNRHDEALPLIRDAISEYQRVASHDVRWIAMARLEYAKTLAALGRFSEAESQQLDAKRELGPKDFYSTVAMIAFYAAWDHAEPDKGHDVQAQEWLTKLVNDNGYRRPTLSEESSAAAKPQAETANPK